MPGEWAIPVEQRLMSRVLKQPNGCWWWGGGITADGYGRCGYKNQPGLGVHRVAYQVFVGPIPSGMKVDHRCHNEDPSCPGGKCDHRRCLNPSHLTLATAAENVLNGKTPAAKNSAKTECVHGHPFDAANTYLRSDGARGCRTCRRGAGARHDARRRSSKAVA